MKFQIASREQRRLKAMVKMQDQFKWHVYFAWLPVRFDKATVVWLERVARRRSMRDGTRYSLWRFSYYRSAGFEYGPIHNVLMQPGVMSDGSAGVSAAQANSSAIQSGLITPPGYLGQAVQLQWRADACPSPQGGLNIIGPKPGP